MTEWMLVCSHMVTGSVRMFACFVLLSWVLSARAPGKKSCAACIAGAAGISLLLAFFALPDFYALALETIWITFWAGRIQKADVRMSLFVAVFYETAAAFWEFLFSAGLGIWFRSPKFLDPETFYGQIPVWLLHILLLAFVLYFFRDPHISAQKAFALVSALAVAEFLGVITLSQQTVLKIPDDTIDMWTILAVILMMGVLVFNMNRQYEGEKELAELKEAQAELLEHDYHALSQAYAANAKLFHDFHNHMGVLRQFLIEKKYENALQYLDELNVPVKQITDQAWTGNEALDYLISSKSSSARSKGIQFQAQVEFPHHTNIKNADLCAILGNLLDNALEGACQMPKEKEPFIRLTIRRINQMLIIKVENSFQKELKIHKDGSLQSTKEEKGLHGWGLKSAQTAAEKYDGMVQTSFTDSTFMAVATLSYEGVSAK